MGANSYLCRSYRRKTGRGRPFRTPIPPFWIGLTGKKLKSQKKVLFIKMLLITLVLRILKPSWIEFRLLLRESLLLSHNEPSVNKYVKSIPIVSHTYLEFSYIIYYFGYWQKRWQLEHLGCFNFKFLRIKWCKIENRSREKQNPIGFN